MMKSQGISNCTDRRVRQAKEALRRSGRTVYPTGASVPSQSLLRLTHPTRGSSGYALLIVLGVLALFAVLGIAFSMKVRVEETTSVAWRNACLVNDVANAGLFSAQSMLQLDQEGLDKIPFSGDERGPVKFLDPQGTVLDGQMGPFDSQIDLWYPGVCGNVGTNTFDVRRFNIKLEDENRISWRTLGYDEDPPGDDSGDGAPGLADADDDIDGVTDEDRHGEPIILDNGNANGNFDLDYISDDDEDGRIDEDRPDSSPIGGGNYPPGSGLDNDDDALGIEDECSKISLNLAGNLSLNDHFSYHQGIGPWELDLGMFLAGRLIPDPAQAHLDRLVSLRDFAEAIVQHRYGSDLRPGEAGVDDRNPLTTASYFAYLAKITRKGTTEEGIPEIDSVSNIVGNALDDNLNGYLDDEAEWYIGAPCQPNKDYWRLNRPWKKEKVIREIYLPGDGIDNDGDGEIDEIGENVDEPEEFVPSRPFITSDGDAADTPWTSLEEFRSFVEGNPANVAQLLETGKTLDEIYQFIKPMLTLNSSSALYGPNFYAEDNQGVSGRRLLCPNLLSTYTPLQMDPTLLEGRKQEDISEDLAHPDRGNSPPLYSLAYPADVSYLFPLGIDDDDDWTAKNPRYPDDPFKNRDLNGNGSPDADWDGAPESSPPAGISVWPPLTAAEYDEVEAETQDEYDPAKDLDHDKWMGDHGDFNADGQPRYDPEWGVNEDPPGRADGKEDSADPKYKETYPGFKGFDDDDDGRSDLRDKEVDAAVSDPEERDKVDNDGDGMVDELGETYVVWYDDDEDGRWDEDGPEIQFWANLMDSIDEPPLCLKPTESDYQNKVYPDVYENASNAYIYDANLAAGAMSEGMAPGKFEFINWTARNAQDATPSRDFLLDTNRGLDYSSVYPYPFFNNKGKPINTEKLRSMTNARGVEAIRINEVAAYPLMRIQMEHVSNGSVADWTRKTSAKGAIYFMAQQEKDKTKHEWVIEHVPAGEYAMVLCRARETIPDGYSWPNEVWVNGVNRTADFTFPPGPNASAAFTQGLDDPIQDNDKTIEVDDTNTLRIKLVLDAYTQATSGQEKYTSIDYIELIRWKKYIPPNTQEQELQHRPDLDLQYVELINIAENPYPIDLSGWSIKTPAGNVFKIPAGTLLGPDDPLTLYKTENCIAIVRDETALIQIYFRNDEDLLEQDLDPSNIKDWTKEDLVKAANICGLIPAKEGKLPFGITTEVAPESGYPLLHVTGLGIGAASALKIQLWGPQGSGILVDEMEIPSPVRVLYGNAEGAPTLDAIKWTMPIQVFERGDPTATEYTLNGPIRSVTPEHWAKFYAKDAFVFDKSRPYSWDWNWDPMLLPKDPAFFCYTHPKNNNASTAVFVWLNPPLWSQSADGEDRFLRVRVFGENNKEVGEIVLEGVTETVPTTEYKALMHGGVSGATQFVRITQSTPSTSTPDPSDYVSMRTYLNDQDRYKSYLHLEIGHSTIAPVTENSFKYVEFTDFGDVPSNDENPPSLWYLSGTPAKPNPLYKPFYYDKSQEHRKSLVKNARLANFYELSRIATGGEFEVLGVNKAAKLTDLVRFQMTPSSRYSGLININTASRAVLMALPWMEPVWADLRPPADPNDYLAARYEVADRIATAIVNYRERMPNGFDKLPNGTQTEPGRAGVDDDLDGTPDNPEERNWPGSDDPPFDTIGDLAILFTNPASSVYLGLGSQAFADVSGMENATPASVFGRVANLITVRSEVFSVRAKGQVISSDGEKLAEKVIDAVTER